MNTELISELQEHCVTDRPSRELRSVPFYAAMKLRSFTASAVPSGVGFEASRLHYTDTYYIN